MACQELTGIFTSMTYCNQLQVLLLNGKMFYCSRPPLISFSLVLSCSILIRTEWSENFMLFVRISYERKMCRCRRLPMQAVQQDVTKDSKQKYFDTNFSGQKLE